MMFQIIHFAIGAAAVLFFMLATLATIRSQNLWPNKRHQIYDELKSLSTGTMVAAAGVYLLLGMGYQAAAWVFGFAS